MVLATGLSSCLFGGDTPTGATANESISTLSDIQNAETNVSITVPGGWVAVKDGQRQSTDLYAVHPEDKLHVAVLSENKDVLSLFDFENNAAEYRWLIQEELDVFERETRMGTTSVNTAPALQYEIRGQVNDTAVVYLHTTVQGVNSYYQIVGWTTEDSYLENKDILEDIIASFRTI